MHPLAQLDHRYVWHPFTQMRDWIEREPILIVSGQGSVLRDSHGKEYLDANASIWTNLHGHNHPKINAAIRGQLRKIAHSSALGLANEPASLLAEALVNLANPGPSTPAGISHRISATSQAGQRLRRVRPFPYLGKVFFSDDGSTALEVALKLAYEFARRSGCGGRPRFLSLEGAYHGDTVGAASLGHIDLFQRAYRGLLFSSDRVMAPYCYRCPFNRARPERADARVYRQCRWECVGQVEQRFRARKRRKQRYAGFLVEPILQGAAGMIPQPHGWLRRVADIARDHGTPLIADEVMSGFGRTGLGTAKETISGVLGKKSNPNRDSSSSNLRSCLRSSLPLFACHQEGVRPDFLALAKGLSGGYLPLAATLTTQEVFDAFLGEYDEFKTFFHGHSYTANQLGCAAARANLELLQSPASLKSRANLERVLTEELKSLWAFPWVGDIRQVGLMAGVEVVRDWSTRESYSLNERVGIRICDAMAEQGVLTRPVGNVIVLLPPYCTTTKQARTMVRVLGESIARVLG
jgi:adenosylmethionine---8-amino-7-oxononanoate aminotransferase